MAKKIARFPRTPYLRQRDYGAKIPHSKIACSIRLVPGRAQGLALILPYPGSSMWKTLSGI